MGKLRVLDLFSGIGGFSLGLERTGGFETVAFCEIEEFPRKVLAKHWSGVPIYEDVATADFGSVGPVDLVTGGFPCQDISFAGAGAGLTGERSGLFWHILRAAGMVGRPKLLLENVAALLNRGLGAVLGALAQIGYDAEWHCIPASAVGAPHRRDRIWIACNANDEGQSACAVHDEAPWLSDVANAGCGRRGGQEGWEVQQPRRAETVGASQDGADPNGLSAQGLEPGGAYQEERAGQVQRPAGPLLTSVGGQWEPEPGVGRVADGVPDRAHRIAALGNAVVPQIPEMIGRAILEASA